MVSQTHNAAHDLGLFSSHYREELDRLAKAAFNLFSANICAVFALNGRAGQFSLPPVIAGNMGEASEGLMIQPEFIELANQVAKEDQVRVGDIARQAEYQNDFFEAEKIQSFVGVQLTTEDSQNIVAVLFLFFVEPRQLSNSASDQLQAFTAYSAQGLQQAWYLYRHQEIIRISQEISQTVDTVEACFKQLRKDLPPILDISHFFMLATYSPHRSVFDLFLSEQGQYRLLPNNELNGGYEWVLQAQGSLMIDELSAKPDRLPPLFESIPGTDFRDRESLIFIPLWFNEAPQGLLSVQHPDQRAYRADDLQLLELLGRQIASILGNLSLRENIRQLNDTGQLLTRHLESDRVLQNLVEQIRITTKSDLVLLYPYQEADQRFEQPPFIGGSLLAPTTPQPDTNRIDDLAMLALRHGAPIFADDNVELYKVLRGNNSHKKGSFAKREKVHASAVVPLHVLGESVGVLFCNFRHPLHFDQLKQELIQGLANYAAIAIKNARKFQSLTDQSYRQLESLQEIDRQISRSLDLDTLLSTMLELASKNIEIDKGGIFLYNKRTEELVKRAAVGRDAKSNLKQAVPLQEERGLTRLVFLEKRAIRVGNVQADSRYLKRSETTRSELDAPLLDEKGQVIGVINLESDRENAFGERDEVFLVTLAGQAVLAIQNAQTFARQARLLKERERLNRISQRIIRELDETKIFDLILEQALEATQAEAGTLMRYNQRTRELQMAAGRGVAEDKVGEKHSIDEGITGYVARHRKLLNVGDINEPPWANIHLPFIPSAQSELAVPLLEGGRLIGVINVESTEAHHFSEENELLLSEFANLAVIAIQNVDRYQETENERLKLAALRAVDREIIRQVEDSDRTVQTILKQASILTGAEEAGLFLYKQGVQTKVYRARLNLERGEILPDKFTPSRTQSAHERRGIIEHVIDSHQSYITLGDAQDDPHYQGSSDIHSEIAVPLVSPADDELIGVLNLESPRLHALTEDHLALLELFAGQTVIAIQNAENYDQLKKASHRLQLLYQAGQELGEITINDHIDDAYEVITHIANEYSQSEVIIRRFKPTTEELVIVHTASWDNPPLLSKVKLQDNRASSWVARTGKTLVVADIDNPPAEAVGIESADPTVKSFVNTGIRFEDTFYGNLAVTDKKVNYFDWDTDDIKLIEGLAHQLAITIHRLETVEAQQEAEKRAQEAEVMGQFGTQSFELAHRLGNDLGLIRSYVNNVNSRLEVEDVSDSIIDRNLENIVRDVQRVLQLSLALKEELVELGSGTEAELASVSVEMIIDEAAAGLANVPPNIQIQREIAPDTGRMWIRPNLATQVLYNLLTNAVEAMPGGGIITLQAYDTRRYVFIEVSDTGVGIEPNKREKIFGFLYSTKGQDGTGFGLWSARRKALQNGGDLRLKASRPGEGATFILSFPKASATGSRL